MAEYKKGDKVYGGLAVVTKVTKVPKSQMMSLKNPFGLVYPYRYHYKFISGPMKGKTGSAGCR